MKKTFFISDTHFNHNRIIELANRPFSSVEEMNEHLITNWNSVVSNQDDVYFLGDFCWSNKKLTEFDLIKQLNGNIYWNLGNHDNRQNVKQLHYEGLIQGFEYYREITLNTHKIILCHYPIEEWNGRFRGNIHLFGHVHNQPYAKIKNRYNMSVENINYTPIEFEEVIEKIKVHNESF